MTKLVRFKEFLRARLGPRETDTNALPFELQRRYAVMLLADCWGEHALRVRIRLLAAKSSADLRQMRGAVFECIARGLNQTEAIDRLHSFDQCISGAC
jgi:hypothetical protein